MSGDSPPSPSVEVFISYASHDAAVANAVVEILERHGIACWIAPRDVVPGSLYADAIVGAINDAKVVVLVLSEQSLASPHVGKEIERASSKRRRIIALHIDSAPLTPSTRPCHGERSSSSPAGREPQADERMEEIRGHSRRGRRSCGRIHVRRRQNPVVDARRAAEAGCACCGSAGDSGDPGRTREVRGSSAIRRHERAEGSGVFIGRPVRGTH